MKQYTNPIMNIVTLAPEDLLTTSVVYGGTGVDNLDIIQWKDL